MGKQSRSRANTMAAIVAEERTRPKLADRRSVSPGRMNRDGDLCDPGGTTLTKLEGDWTEEDALAAVRSGALVAFEGCGCGYGCTPEWFDAQELDEVTEPPLSIRGDAPSWIEIWHSPGRQVVFVHGDFTWAGLF